MGDRLHSLPFPCSMLFPFNSQLNLSGRFSLPAANQLFPRLGRGSRSNKTRDDKGGKGKGKPSKLLLQQRLAHKSHSSPGMLSRSVQSDSPSATSCPPLEQQASGGTASLGSLKGTFPASDPSKSPNTSIHLSPVCTDESCINPAPNAVDESLLSCATAQLHQDGPFPLQGPAPSQPQILSSSPTASIWKEKSVTLQD